MENSLERAANNAGCSFGARLLSRLHQVASRLVAGRRERHLRLCETLSLGERRFLAVVQYHEHRFLVAGTSHSIALLRQLDPVSAGDQFSLLSDEGNDRCQ